MNDLQKYQPEARTYQFPTQLPETPGGLTPYQKQLREIEFVNHVSFQRRRVVTIIVAAVVVATLVAHVVTNGINWTALGATLCGVGAAFAVRNIHTPRHTGTNQNHYQ